MGLSNFLWENFHQSVRSKMTNGFGSLILDFMAKEIIEDFLSIRFGSCGSFCVNLKSCVEKLSCLRLAVCNLQWSLIALLSQYVLNESA